VRACVNVGARARGSVHVALLIQYTTRMRYIVTSIMAPQSATYFSALSHKRCDFRKKKLLNIKCVILFSLHVLSKTFPILRSIYRDSVKNVETSSCKVPVISVGF
jgi:hypothetical protein